MRDSPILSAHDSSLDERIALQTCKAVVFIDAFGDADSYSDADSYAEEMAVSRVDAESRLRLQAAAGDLDATLTSKAGSMFGRLWIEHKPDFHVDVLLTDPTRDIDDYVAATGLSWSVEIRKATHSLEELEADAAEIVRNAGPGTRPFDLNVDVFRNVITLEAASFAALDSFLDSRSLELLNTAEVVLVGSLSKPAANIYGGLALSPCTSGFSVKNSAGLKGIVTAGHCDNSVSYSGMSLPYEGGSFTGSNDEQWHTAPGFTVKNWLIIENDCLWINTGEGSTLRYGPKVLS